MCHRGTAWSWTRAPRGVAFCSLLVNAEETQGRKSLCVWGRGAPTPGCGGPARPVLPQESSWLLEPLAHRSTSSEGGNAWGTSTSSGKGDAFRRDLLWAVPR